MAREIFLLRPTKDYVFLGYSNGVLRLHKIDAQGGHNSHPFMNLNMENYWVINLHDASNGAIRSIYPIDTISGHLVMTCSKDGSILMHKVDQTLEDTAENARESLEDLEAKYGENDPTVKKLKSKLKLTWEDAAVAGQIQDEKVHFLPYLKYLQFFKVTNTTAMSFSRKLNTITLRVIEDEIRYFLNRIPCEHKLKLW